MSRTRFEVRFIARASRSRSGATAGVDAGRVLHLAESGRGLKPLARIVSGGELSRIMLALKTLASTDAPGKTLIFDEVDAGIGGASPTSSAARLQRLGGPVPGALHHAPAADRRVRRDALPDRQDASGQGRTSTRVARLERRGARGGTGADDRRRHSAAFVPARVRCSTASAGPEMLRRSAGCDELREGGSCNGGAKANTNRKAKAKVAQNGAESI